jgi:ABC-type phosphate transport system substrate-binding protein
MMFHLARTFRRVLGFLGPILLFGAFLMPATPASAAVSVYGSGSTWSQIAIDQWRADVAKFGLSINYQGNGSTTGRLNYIDGITDFGASEIPFQPASLDRNGQTVYSEIDQAAKRPYAYLPDVAGGTSLLYHLDINGSRITNLRLSGETIAKIFTGGITNWDDPAITHDYGHQLPNMPITVVLRSDGSGTSAQLSLYFKTMYPSIWNAFCQKYANIPPPCPEQSLYPYFPGSQNASLSDGVANYVVAPYGNGAITYVEYGYAVEHRFPVVSVLNAAGYYTQPTAQNVAIALTAARIHPDFTQDLSGVYTNPLPSTYPISSYSYMIVPRTLYSPGPEKFTTATGNALGQFINYVVCTGQQKAAILGYSPLPKNLVQFAFQAEQLIPGAPKPPALTPSACDNPTITNQFTVDQNAAPPASAKVGSAPPPISSGGGGGSAPAGSFTQGNSSGGNSSGGGTSATTLPTASATKLAGGKVATSSAGTSNGQNSTQTTGLADQPISVSKGSDGVPLAVYVLVGTLMLLAVFAPPTIGILAKRKR